MSMAKYYIPHINNGVVQYIRAYHVMQTNIPRDSSKNGHSSKKSRTR